MAQLEEVFGRIDQYGDEIIEIQSELTSRVALGTQNGGSGEHDKVDYVKELLKSMAPDILEEIKAPDEKARGGYRPNLIARWGTNRDLPAVWLH